MPTKNVKIFTGFVSQEQLVQDMSYLQRSLNKLRSIFATRGVRLRTDQCDADDPAQIHEAVADSDVCVFLFKDDVPQLARTQFDAAYQQFVTSGESATPSIFVWFRETNKDELTDALRAFQDELDHEMGHFFSRYSNVDTVQFQLLLHLEREGVGMPFTCAGTTLVDARGNVVMDFSNTAAFQGNEMLRAVREQRRQLEERQEELLDRELDEGLSESESDELSKLMDQISDIAQKESELQAQFLADMRQFVDELATDKHMSPRRRRAIRLISAGRVREGYELLNVDEIAREGHEHEDLAQEASLEYHAHRAQVLDAVKTLLTRVRALHTFVEEEGETKDEEIRHTYAVAIDFERRNGFVPEALVGYGAYLLELGIYDSAIDQLDEACVWYRAHLATGHGPQVASPLTDDPLLPSKPELLRGLSHALRLKARACLGGEHPDTESAGYAASDRVQVVRELYATEGVKEDVLDYAACLVDAAEMMADARRPDDAFAYLDEATQLLEMALADADSDAQASEAPAADDDLDADDVATQHALQLRGTLVRALDLRRTIYLKQKRQREAADASLALVQQCRAFAQAQDSASADKQLAKELINAANELLNQVRPGNRRQQERASEQARELMGEALQVQATRYERQPSAETALALVETYRRGQMLMGRLHDKDAFVEMGAGRLDTLRDELVREASVPVQKVAGETARDLYFRWLERPELPMAKALAPRYSSLAHTLAAAAAPGEDSFAAGNAVGDCVAAAIVLTTATYGPSSTEALRMRQKHLDRLREMTDTSRGIAVYSGAFDRLARRLREQGRTAEAYGIASERLCTLRLVCGTEVALPEPDDKSVDQNAARAEAFAAAPKPTVTALRQLARALYFEENYAQRYRRDAEAHGLMAEHLDALRKVVEADGSLFDHFQLNGLMVRIAARELEDGALGSFGIHLQEWLEGALALADAQDDLDSLRNLGYVGKEVAGSYLAAGMADKAKQVQDECLARIEAYRAEHASVEVDDWAATAVWNFVLAACEFGPNEALRDEAYQAYVRMAGELAQASDTAYLAYLHRHINGMLTGYVKTGINHEVASTSVELASQAFDEREAAGQIGMDDARTLSSVFEQGVLITLELGFDDLAEDYVQRCISLYEERLAQAREQGGQEALSEVECATQLAGELSRMAKSMRRFGHPERGAELWQRAEGLLRREHERQPGDRVSYKYGSMLFKESERLDAEGDVDGALALRKESVAVLGRYQQADPTLRNVLLYATRLSQLANYCLEKGYADEAAVAEQRMFEVLDERYQALHERQALRRYLVATGWINRRLHEEGGQDNDVRARKLLERGLFLAQDNYDRHQDVEAARPLSAALFNLWNLYNDLGLRDEAGRMTERQVEVQRFLFALAPTMQLAQQFKRTLQGRENALRYRAKHMGQQDCLKQANELRDERIDVMHWAARHNATMARDLVDLLTGEVSIRFSDEPWVLKRMMRHGEEGHNYPLELGVRRSRMCLDALGTLWANEPSRALAQETRDMRGVLVQFLVQPRYVDGQPEPEEALLARQAEAAGELRRLLPALERDYAHDASQENAYRLAFFLKLAAMAFEATEDDPANALAALRRREEVLGEVNRKEESATSGLKYEHALRDLTQLCERAGDLQEAQRAEARRADIVRALLGRDDLDEATAKRLHEALRECLSHQDKLFEALGAGYEAKRLKVLVDYVNLLQAEVDEQGGQASVTRLRKMVAQLSLIADLAESTGDTVLADRSLARAEELAREAMARRIEAECDEAAAEASAGGEEGVLLAGGQLFDMRLASVLLQHAQIAAARPQQDEGAAELQLALLDEAFGLIGPETRFAAEKAAELSRLHLLHADLLEAAGQSERAVASMQKGVALMEQAGPDMVPLQELREAQHKLVGMLQANGQEEIAEQLRDQSAEALHDEYEASHDFEVGVWLASDMAKRAKQAQAEGDLATALSFALERWKVLCGLEAQDGDQAALLDANRSNATTALANLVYPLMDAPEGDVDDALRTQAEDALAQVERDVVQQVREDVAGSPARYLDLMRRRLEGCDQWPSQALQLEQVARYALQTSRLGRRRGATGLDSGKLWGHLGNAARLFDLVGSPLDADECRDEALALLMMSWRRLHDNASATQLDQVFKQCFERCDSPERELWLVRQQLEVVRGQRERGMGVGTANRVAKLSARMMELCEQLGLHREAAEMRLALAEDAYERAEDAEQLEPLAQEIKTQLEGAVVALKGLGAKGEARFVATEAATCAEHLGRPGVSWWRLGERNTIKRAWTRKSELGLAQKRLQRGSHVLYRSLTLGDWDEEDWKRRNLRNLMTRRQQAYAKGLADDDRARKLNALRWCLFNAANLLESKRAANGAYLAESVALRCEQLEVLSDLMRLQKGKEGEAKARKDYQNALKDLLRLLEGSEYQSLAYQDVSRWAQGLLDSLS